MLLDALQTWLPCHATSWNHKFADIRFPRSRKPIEIDIYLADLGLGVEYQGEQHYRPVEWYGGREKHEAQTKRDRVKRDLFARDGRRLVEISYWWDRTLPGMKVFFEEQLGVDEVRRLEASCHEAK
jgi:hypothetical protein